MTKSQPIGLYLDPSLPRMVCARPVIGYRSCIAHTGKCGGDRKACLGLNKMEHLHIICGQRQYMVENKQPLYDDRADGWVYEAVDSTTSHVEMPITHLVVFEAAIIQHPTSHFHFD